MPNSGLENEKEIIAALDGKSVASLNPSLKALVESLFPLASGTISCSKGLAHEKPDLVISLGSEIRYVSVKSGHAVSVHEESLTTLIPFFRSLEIPNHILKTLVYFHYGDGTLDGTGPTRFTSENLRHLFKSYFHEASSYLTNRRFISPFFERFVFRGIETNGHEVDALYYGGVEKGISATRKEIYKSLYNHPYRHTGTINLGPLTYQPAVRNFYGYGEEEKRRNEAEIKWRGIGYDLGDIRRASHFKEHPEERYYYFDGRRRQRR